MARGSGRTAGGQSMAGLRIVAIALIVLGVIAFAYQGITYTKREKVLEVGPITATKESKETIPLPPVLGGLALAGGVALLVFSTRGGRR
jgi:hypothetical protein